MKKITAKTADKLSAIYAVILGFYISVMFPAPAKLGAVNSRRGMTFLEYAIMAAIILAVALVIAGMISGTIEGLWTNVSNSWQQFQS